MQKYNTINKIHSINVQNLTDHEKQKIKRNRGTIRLHERASNSSTLVARLHTRGERRREKRKRKKEREKLDTIKPWAIFFFSLASCPSLPPPPSPLSPLVNINWTARLTKRVAALADFALAQWLMDKADELC